MMWALVLLVVATVANAQVPAITGIMTVNEFSIQCQHAGMKSHPMQRQDSCLAYLRAAIDSIGDSNRTDECWQDIKTHASPLAVSDTLYYFAAQPSEKRSALAAATREIVLIAAKKCR